MVVADNLCIAGTAVPVVVVVGLALVLPLTASATAATTAPAGEVDKRLLNAVNLCDCRLGSSRSVTLREHP